MRLPIVMAHKVVIEDQCIDFLAQPPLWSAEGIGWRSSLELPFNNIEINTRREVTPNDERRSDSKVITQIAAGRSAKDRERTIRLTTTMSGHVAPRQAGIGRGCVKSLFATRRWENFSIFPCV